MIGGQMYAILCSEQLDGISAAAILARYAKLKGKQYKIMGFLHYPTLVEELTPLTLFKNNLFFILDINPERFDKILPVLEKIAGHNRLAYWNTHHPCPKETKSRLSQLVQILDFADGKKLCSAELTCDRFLPYDRVSRELARIAHDLEFWERLDARSQKLADLIASGYDLKSLIESLARGAFWSETFEKICQDYIKKKENALNDLIKRLVVKQYLRYNFGFSLAPQFLPTADAGQKILDSHQAVDVSVVVYRNGRVSFRRRAGCELDLSKLARLFNGGGHAYAAGGHLQIAKPVSHEQFESVLFQLDRKFKDFFLA